MLFALKNAKEPSERIEHMKDLATYYAEVNIVKTRCYADTILEISNQTDSDAGRAVAWFFYGCYHEQFGAHQKAFDAYVKSLDLFQSLKDYKSTVALYNSLGRLAGLRKEDERALSYFRKAATIAEAHDFYANQGNVYNNLGVILADQGLSDSAVYYFEKASSAYGKVNVGSHALYPKVNIVNELMVQGNYRESEHLLKQLYQQSLEFDDLVFKANIFLCFSQLYRELDKYNLAMDNLNEAHDIFQKLQITSLISDVYQEYVSLSVDMQNFEEALEWSNKLSELKETIFNAEKEESMARMQARFELKTKEQKIKGLLQESKLQRERYIVLACLIFIGGLIFLFWQRSRFLRKRKEVVRQKKVLEMDAERLMTEQQRMKMELEFQTSELSTFALHLVQKNEFLEQLENALHSLDIKNNKTNESVKDILFSIRQNQLIGKDLSDLYSRLKTSYGQFFQQLRDDFPNLTKKDERLAALLRLGLSTKEIASLNYVSESAIKMSRHRLRKKLRLDASTDLNYFFQNV